MIDLIRREDVLRLIQERGNDLMDDYLESHAIEVFAVGKDVEALPAVKAVELADDVDQSKPVGWAVYMSDSIGNPTHYVYEDEDDAIRKAGSEADDSHSRGDIYPLYAGKPEDVTCR